MESPCDHGHRLLAGDGVPCQCLAVGTQVHSGGVKLQDGILPVTPRRIGESLSSGDGLELQKTVHDASKSATGDGIVGMERAVLIALDDMVFLAPFLDTVLGPMALRISKRHGGHHSQSSPQRSGSQPFEKSDMMHDGPFLSVFVGRYFKKAPQPEWAAVLCHLCNSAY